ncbi:hypothetical protein Godav_010745 [Gossypium davidsonii]|uniref:DNA-directed RNA polymerase subunit n=1 Tax=Gossypium davidsonii TaxID=34287 RepID=A0A7J8R7K1_GOSDV|nr:hypothetical protein [Gossypium davidsonii]
MLSEASWRLHMNHEAHWCCVFKQKYMRNTSFMEVDLKAKASSLEDSYCLDSRLEMESWKRNMQLHPRHFGRNLRENLVSKLMKDVEGTCSGRHGFVVAITGIENVGKGLIRDGTGFVTFPVKYQCVVFRPFKGEILEAAVTMMGFFAETGPVQIFVSNHLIPDDMEFQSGDMPNYTTSDGSVKIQKDSEVRLKIIGTRVDATEIMPTVESFKLSLGIASYSARILEYTHVRQHSRCIGIQVSLWLSILICPYDLKPTLSVSKLTSVYGGIQDIGDLNT